MALIEALGIGGNELQEHVDRLRAPILTCLSGGVRVKGQVPPVGRVHIGHADERNESATIAVRTRADETVVASCR